MKSNDADLTISQFARRNGVSQPAISKAVAAGRLPTNKNGKLGKAAQTAWNRARTIRGTHAGTLAELASIKMRRERVRLEREELELAERRGKLVDTAQVDSALAIRFQQFRDHLRRLPNTLSPALSMQPEDALRTLLSQAIDEALTELSEIKEFTH